MGPLVPRRIKALAILFMSGPLPCGLGCDCLWLGELWPDQVPVVGAHIAAKNSPFGLTFQSRRQLGRARPQSINDVLEMPARGTACSGQLIALGHSQGGEVCLEVHTSITSNDVPCVNIV